MEYNKDYCRSCRFADTPTGGSTAPGPPVGPEQRRGRTRGAAVGDGLPPWAGDEPAADEQPPGRRTRPWVLGLAVVPWLVVLGLVLGGTVPGRPGSQQAPADGTAPSTAPGPSSPQDSGARQEAPAEPGTTAEVEAGAGADAGAAAPSEAGGPPVADEAAGTSSPPGGTRAGGGRDTGPVEAVALAVARAWLTDVGPRLEIEGIDPHEGLYLEHGVVERVDRHGDHAVASVLAVVLTREGDAYTGVDLRRLAVPVALGAPPRPAGAPWWLGGVEVAPSLPEPLTEVEDPGVLLSISEALAAAGIDGPELVSASRTDDGWWLAHLSGDDGQARPAPVWLRPGPDGPVVAGPAPPPASEDRKERR